MPTLVRVPVYALAIYFNLTSQNVFRSSIRFLVVYYLYVGSPAQPYVQSNNQIFGPRCFLLFVKFSYVLSLILLRESCNFQAAKMTVSSTKVAIVLFSISQISLISLVYSRYKTGPNTLPCGTPALISVSLQSLYYQLF